MEDQVLLKNGGSWRGKLMEDSAGLVRLRTNDGSILVFSAAEILGTSSVPRYGIYRYHKGFAHFTELGPLVAGKTSIDGVTTAAFSFQTVNGYNFRPWLFTGLGIGADLYATQTILPLFGSMRGDLFSGGSVIPFYFAEAGYGFNITQDSNAGEDFKGGLTYAAGLGIKVPFNRKAGFSLGLGYRYQESRYMQTGSEKEVLYKRLAIRAGFFL